MLLGVTNVFGEQCRGERHERHAEQEQAIEDEQQVVGALHQIEQLAMIDPHDADGREADQKSKISGPLFK